MTDSLQGLGDFAPADSIVSDIATPDTADLAHCCAGLYCRACAVERGYAAINVQRRLAQPGRW